MPWCRRLRRWHGASLPSSVEILVLLSRLEFLWDWQLAQLLVEACHLVSSQAVHRHPQLTPVRGGMWAPFDHSRDYVSGTIASFSSCVSWRLSSCLCPHTVSSLNSTSIVCRENARASQ